MSPQLRRVLLNGAPRAASTLLMTVFSLLEAVLKIACWHSLRERNASANSFDVASGILQA